MPGTPLPGPAPPHPRAPSLRVLLEAPLVAPLSKGTQHAIQTTLHAHERRLHRVEARHVPLHHADPRLALLELELEFVDLALELFVGEVCAFGGSAW